MSERLSDERLAYIASGATVPRPDEVAVLAGDHAAARAVVEAAWKYRHTAMLAPLWDALDIYDERMMAGAGADDSATRKDAAQVPSGTSVLSTPSPAPAACAPPADMRTWRETDGGPITRESQRASATAVFEADASGFASPPGFPYKQPDASGGSMDTPPAATPEERAAQVLPPDLDDARREWAQHSNPSWDGYRADIAAAIRAAEAAATAAAEARVRELEAKVEMLRVDLGWYTDERERLVKLLAESRAAAPAGWSPEKVRAAEALMRAVEERTQVRFGTRDPLGMMVAEVSIPEPLWMAYYAAAVADARPPAQPQGGREEARSALKAALVRFVNGIDPSFITAREAEECIDALDRYLAAREGRRA